jgi:hypothetical protein
VICRGAPAVPPNAVIIDLTVPLFASAPNSCANFNSPPVTATVDAVAAIGDRLRHARADRRPSTSPALSR